MPVKVKIISSGNSSHKYGNCEICRKHAGEMFHLFNYTQKPQISRWGHLECLEAYAERKGYEINLA